MLRCFFLLAAIFSALVAADIHIPKTTASINVDGDLSDPAWAQANTVQIEINSWPSENTPAPVATEALLIENGEYFYLAFKAKDPNPSQIRAFLKDRDSVWEDDLVGIKIDSYNDQKLAYQFFSNPLGVQADAIENEVTGNESDAWDGIWESVGQLTNDGYQVEMAIPLRILNFNDKLSVQQWRIELVRFYPRDVKHRLSSNKIERDNPCWICQMRVATGFSGAKQGSHFSVVPSLVSGANQQRDITPEAKTAWQTQPNTEVGLDLKWGITPDINLNATVNPDFSQVEADVAQVSMNDTFSLFFDEKRAFFLDNRDYFSSPLDLVYTRNIGAPDIGAKLTGKQQQHSFAFFAANDEKTTFIVPGNLGSDVAVLNEKSNNAVLRYRYDLNEELSLGWISSLRQSDSYHNNLSGLDLKYKITTQDELVLQYLYADSSYSEPLRQSFGSSEAALRLADDLSDPAYFLKYSHDDGAWFWNSQYLVLEKEFRADMGYMPQTDFHKVVQGLGHQWFSQSSWWNRAILSADWDISHNANNELLEKEAEIWLEFWGPQQSFLSFSLVDRNKTGPRLNNNSLAVEGNTLMFNEKRLISFAEFRPLPELYANTEVEVGDAIDYRNNRLGDLLQLSPEVSWNASTHLQIEARHTYRYLEADGTEVFTANLTDVRFSYQFTVRSLLRLTLIYSDIKQNPLNNPGLEQQQERSLGSQLLYSFKLNPQTLFFAGYSDNAYQDDELTNLERDQRSVFMKFSYAWLF